MKKILTLLLALTVVFCAVSCGPNIMTHDEFMAAEMDSEVVIEAYVQAKQSWWDNKGTFYLQDQTGGYFVYEMPCSESEYNSLVTGTKIRVTGKRAAWAGMDEIMNVSEWKIIEGDTYTATAVDLTSYIANKDELVKYTSMLATFKDMTVVSFEYGDDDYAKDIYLTLSKDGANYTFCVEYYLTDADSDVYKAVEALVAGDVVDIEGFVYWYNTLNTHVTKVTKK